MSNLFIKWSDSCNTGIPIIDEQHRGVVSAFNTLHFFLKMNSGVETLNNIINLMKYYAKVHFATEEMLFELSGYPLAAEHKELHAKLTSQTFSVGNKSKLMSDPMEFMDFLKGWWMEHIVGDDLKYSEHIRSYLEARNTVFLRKKVQE